MMEWALTSSVLIAAVIALRFLFRRKISRRLQYALWGLVLLRLLMPVSLFGSTFSVMNAVEDSRLTDSLSGIQVNSDVIENTYMTPEEAQEIGHGTLYAIDERYGESGDRHLRNYIFTEPLDLVLGRIFRIVWLTGGIAAGLWLIGANLVFYRKLRNNREVFSYPDCKLPVYVTGHVASPCLFGIFRPAIYLTPKAVASADSTRHVLAHELCHYRHGDHIWSMLRCLCLAVWWWNPLVWAAAILSRTDGELACDEAAVKKIGQENRLSYGRTLVDMIAIRKSPGLMYAATTMVSGKRGIKERLNMIIKNPKTVISAAVVVLLIAAVCVGCTFTGAKRGHDPAEGTEDVSAYAQQLYDCRVPYIGAAFDDAALIEAMDIFEKLGGYILELETDSEPYVLRLIFSDKMTDVDMLNRVMQENSMLLLALIDNASEIQWRYTYSDPMADGEESFTGSLTIEDANAMLDDTDIKDFGQSAANVQALLDWIASPKINGAEISLDGGEQKILAKRYEKNKFDFDYDSLPVLQITEGGGTFIIMLDSDADTVRIGEDYYTYSGNAGFVDKETYALSREADDTFRLPVEMRGDTRDESAIYYVETDQDLYVFKADFLLEKSAEGGEGNQSQWFTGETYPGNHARALFSLSDGTRAELLLSQPVRQDDTGIWCVERWADEDGNETLVTPDTDGSAMAYYRQLQESCDNGHQPGLLDPKQVALEYISGVLGQSDISGRVHITYDIDRVLNTCVSDAILNVNADLYTDGDFAAEAHTVLKIEEHDNKVYERDEDTGTIRYWIEQDGSETTVYAMVLYLKFSSTEDGLSETGGSHVPVAITFVKNDAGGYVLKEYWEPWDGDAYASSIAGKFPSDIYEDALDTQKYIAAHMQSCYAQAIAYSDVDADAVISGLMDTITSSPSEASSPQAYIDAHEMEYRELIYFGEYTLRYCFTLFEQGGQTGLKGHIMAMVCQDILGDAGAADVPAGTGQTWYDALSQSVKDRYR